MFWLSRSYLAIPTVSDGLSVQSCVRPSITIMMWDWVFVSGEREIERTVRSCVCAAGVKISECEVRSQKVLYFKVAREL